MLTRAQLFYRIKCFLDLKWHIRRVGFFLHRGWYGWASYDTWGFDHYLAEVIAQGVRHLRENLQGALCFDADGNEIDVDEAVKKWEEILEQIDKGFTTYIEAEECEACGYGLLFPRDKECEDHKLEDYDKAWDLFREYFPGLWS